MDRESVGPQDFMLRGEGREASSQRVKGAERVRFEPTVTETATTVFETVTFNHYGTSPECAAHKSDLEKYGEVGRMKSAEPPDE